MALLTFLALAVALAAQQTAGAGADKADDNLKRCFRGSAACDVSVLKPDEISRIAENLRRQNVEDCRNLSTHCDPMALPADEAKRFQGLLRLRNLDKCLNGYLWVRPRSTEP